MLDPTLLAGLVDRHDLAISMYVPLTPEMRDIRMQSATLRDAVGEIERKLEQRGLDPRQREEILTPLREGLGGLDIAQHRDPALAVFMANGAPRVVPLPEEVASSATVGHHFHVKPLLPLMVRNRRFWLLALSGAKSKLYTVTPFGAQEVPLDLGTPDADPPEGYEHGSDDKDQGVGNPALGDATSSLMDDQPRLVRALQNAIGSDPAPLILAADAKIMGQIRKLNVLPGLQEEGLTMNPFAFPPSELHQRALTLMQPVFEREIDTVLDQINARLGDAASNVAIRLEEILAAAEEGRVDSIVVAADENLWGGFDPATGIVAHGRPSGPDEDLLNQAAAVTLRHGGYAYALPRSRIPRAVPAAATLRY
ncbi:hypothetical protein [Muricoccus aerilatus]|uniref:baeRF3 domain-containing protein n=1 Tax=Muricoccus aerilatus TaxID=452982 RepID=UPI0005C15AD3|nr:hypothetical protein [Roseomonas aerilata]